MKHLILFAFSFFFLAACNNNKTNETSKTEEDSIISTSPDTAIGNPENRVPNSPAVNDTITAPPPPPPKKAPPEVKMEPTLQGSWELEYVSSQKIAFEALYPGKKPVITFNIINNTVSGNTSCNNFTGKLRADSIHINLAEPFTMTKMSCPGEGETAFLQTIKKINKYNIADNVLTFIMGDIAMMRFKRR